MPVRVLRSCLAVATVALALLLTLLMPATPGGASSLLLLGAVAASSAYGGRMSGFLATGLAAISNAWFLVIRPGPGGTGSNDWMQLGVFVLVALGLNFLAAERRRATGAVQRSRDDLERRVEARTSELQHANEALQAGVDVRKRAEEALSQLAAIEASTEEAVLTLRLDGTIVSCNPGAEKLFGYATADLVGRSMSVLFPRGTFAPLPQILERVSRGDSIEPFESVQQQRNGNRIPLVVNISAIKDADGSVRGVCALVRDVTRRKQAERKVALYQHQLRRLASALALAEQRERRRIATELHDHLAQMLVLSRMKIRMLQSTFTSDNAPKTMEEIRLLLDESIEYTRTLIWDLYPPMLNEIGLEAALEWLAEQVQERHGIQVRFEDDEQAKTSDENLRALLFRAVHELLMNVIKHAKASQAIVAVRRWEEQIEIRVEDDGVGFDPDGVRIHVEQGGGFGLFSIREQLAVIGGSFEVRSSPGVGSQAMLRAPLQQQAVGAVRREALHSHPDLAGR